MENRNLVIGVIAIIAVILIVSSYGENLSGAFTRTQDAIRWGNCNLNEDCNLRTEEVTFLDDKQITMGRIGDKGFTVKVDNELVTFSYIGEKKSVNGLIIENKVYEKNNYATLLITKVGSAGAITSYGRYIVKQGDTIVFAKANHEINIETRNQCLDNPCDETVPVTVVKFHRIDNPAGAYSELGIGESVVLSGTSSITSTKKSNIKVTVFSIDPTKKEADIGLAHYDPLVSSEPTSYEGVLDMLNKCSVFNSEQGAFWTTCNEECSKRPVTPICISAMAIMNKDGVKESMLIPCDLSLSQSSYSGTLQCTCCSPP